MRCWVKKMQPGWRGALGHTTWEGRTIEPGDAVFLEVGGCYYRYHAALMRTVFLGDPPDEVTEAARLIDEAVAAAMEVAAAGVSAGDVDAAARAVLQRYSFGGSQATRSGYSIGISFAPDWGEGHILSLQSGERRPLEENMTFHLIPWMQMPGKWGMGISETIRIKADGCERLSTLPRGLVVQ